MKLFAVYAAQNAARSSVLGALIRPLNPVGIRPCLDKAARCLIRRALCRQHC